ncbi:MAG: glycoside hydrolase family 3 N-terminal domain-containing protein [Planctomycetota bacterium]|jgi:beta-glucosidase-like glycosyl hydrolase/CubicO group peptidase (beta-lactamase class C family)
MRLLPLLAPVLFSSLLSGELVAAPSAQGWAEKTLQKMSLEEKAGRLLMVWSYSREEGQAAARKRLFELAREGVIGGVVLSLGHRDEAAKLTLELQKHAKHPLLMAGDFETGLSFRLKGTTHVGTAMLIGATGLSRLAHDAGRITAVEGNALGFHMNFGPVLDVNNNPDNPIINVRSFGEDPTAVARLGAAYIRGQQSHGMLATAKHFPGHGDVSKDSHLVLTTVTGDRRRLDSLELPPFRAAIRARVAAIMTAHVAVPGLGEEPGVPATLSKKILTDVLRKELGFDGIIVTDALTMGGVSKVVDDIHMAPLRALEAGADLLLMPKDVRKARGAIVAAVRSGRLAEARLDESVLKLLRVIRVEEIAATQARGQRPHPSSAATAAAIARRGLTLVRDDNGLLPVQPRAGMVLLNLMDKRGSAGSTLVEHLRRGGLRFGSHGLDPRSRRTLLVQAEKAAAGARTLIVAMHVRVRSYSGRIGLPPVFDGIVAVIRKHPQAIVLSFGNPYLVRGFPTIKTYVCAFDHGEGIEQAAAEALTGKQPVTGRLPVRIPGVAPRGYGLSVGFAMAAATAPDREGLAKDLEPRIRKYLEQAIADRVFPGAVALVTRRGHIVAELAVGSQGWDQGSKQVATDTVYDMASLTKVCATLPALLTLVARGKLDLDDKVQDHLPGFRGKDKDKVTIRHLMAHCSGLPGYIRYFLRLDGKDNILRAVLAEPLEYAPGTKTIYSDLGLMLLMAVVEKASGRSFQKYAREIHTALAMSSARFVPVGKPIAAAPTEDCPWRGRVMRGEVHDENAWAMGGISGHAGLFATARDVACLGNIFLAGGGGHWPAPLARQATRRVGLAPKSSRALMWDTFVSGRSCGTQLSDRAFGHTGFTGTSVWCDPRYDLCMVLLTNRVHKSRKHGTRTISDVRGGFHDLVVRSLEDREERN